MKKLAILSIVAILILSGCVSNDDNKDSTKSSSLTSTADANIDVKDVATVDTGAEQKIDVSNDGTEENNIDDTNVDTGSDWCTPGDKITVEIQGNPEEFTIKGMTTYKEREVCQAEKTIQGGSSIRYFNKDGSFVAMISKSSGGSANSNAEAIATSGTK